MISIRCVSEGWSIDSRLENILYRIRTIWGWGLVHFYNRRGCDGASRQCAESEFVAEFWPSGESCVCLLRSRRGFRFRFTSHARGTDPCHFQSLW
jgi:hypothetical protein